MSGPRVLTLNMFNTTEVEAIALWVGTFFSLSWCGIAMLSHILDMPGALV